MNLTFNNYGELIIEDNELRFKAKFSNLDYKDVDEIVSNYKSMLQKHYILSDYFINAHDVEQQSHYLSFIYDVKNYRDFSKMRDLNFKDKIYLYNDLIEIAKFSEKSNVKTLWNPLNFYIDVESNKVKGLLFEFDPLSIPKDNDSLEGLKNIIIHSLTVVEKRLGKPRYEDFIEKDKNIIEYVEKLLSAPSIIAIDKLTKETIQQIEELEAQKKAALIEKQNNKKIKIPSLNKNENNIDPKEEKRKRIKKQLLSNSNLTNNGNFKYNDDNNLSFGQRIKNFTQSTKGIATMGVLFFLLIAIYLTTDGFAMENNSEEEAEESILADQLEQEETIKGIYRDYVNGNEAEAREKLTGLEYEDMEEQDQDLFLDFLIKDEYYTRALSLSDKSAYKIGAIVNEDNVTDIQRVADSEDNPQLDFYLSMYNQSFQNAIEYADKLEVIDKQTALDIVKAYYLTNQQEEFNEFMSAFAPDPEAEEQNTERTQYYNNLSEANALFNNEYMNYNNTVQQLESINSEVGALDNKKKKSDSDKTRLESLKSQKEDLENSEEEAYSSLLDMSIKSNENENEDKSN